MSGLTPKQVQCLRFIASFSRENLCAPSYVEIVTALGLASKSEASRLVLALEEWGWIRRLSHRARSIEVIKTFPGDMPVNMEDRLSRMDGPTFAKVAKAVLAEGQRRAEGRA